MADLPSGPNLRLQVENLGCIAQADVEIRPLTLFVGENNSGQGLLATAVWAALTGAARSFHAPGDPVWKAALEEAGRVLAALEEAVGACAPTVAREHLDEDGVVVATVRGRPVWGRLAASWLARDLPEAILRALPGLSQAVRARCSLRHVRWTPSSGPRSPNSKEW